MINILTITENVNEFIDIAMAIMNHPLIIGTVSLGTVSSVAIALIKFFIPKNKKIQLLEAENKILRAEKNVLIEQNKALGERLSVAEGNINIIAENSLNANIRAIVDTQENQDEEMVEVIVDEAS